MLGVEFTPLHLPSLTCLQAVGWHNRPDDGGGGERVAGCMAKQKIGRNALCPCGSGRKFKHCCLPKVPTPRGDPQMEHSPWVASIGDAARRAGAAPGVAV